MKNHRPALRRWADLDAGLVSLIAECCAPNEYARFRAACSGWRSALPPPASRPLAPVVVLPADDATTSLHHQPLSLAAWSLHAKERWHRLPGLRQPSGLGATASCRCVGARDGWVALVADKGTSVILLFNPVTGVEIPLAVSMCDRESGWVPKVAFSPNPSPRDFAAVSICGANRLAVQRSYDGKGNSVDLVVETKYFMGGAVLADVACCGYDTVYCLMDNGGVQVLHLNRRRRRRRRRGSPKAVEVKPLLTGTDFFPPPYDTISRFTDAKNLMMCDGVMYQIWRRTCGAGSVDDPAGGGARQMIRVLEGDVFVLRYDPGCWPYWTEAKDLGGNAVFIGANDAAVVPGDDATGLRGNCVYYWDRRAGGDYEAVVFDMATGNSSRWLPATGGVCMSSPLWYFLPAGRKHVEATSVEDAAVEVSILDTV